ncbi:MAG: hypothetical protein N3G22_04450 [Candidatus Micrarchaeota archaeon]|nr:hypothetical protein [Candidatus Micrarchaeota archaeon]
MVEIGVPSAKAPSIQPKPATAAAPRVGGFRIFAERIKGVKEISGRFTEIPSLELSLEGDSLSVLNVESRDLKKDPALFSITRFMSDRIEVLYTCLENMSPKKRRVEVLRQFLNLLTLVDDCYEIDMKQIYQLLEASLSEMYEYVSLDYDKLFSLYDSVKTDVVAMQKKINDLTNANSLLSKENYELKNKNDELVMKIKELQAYSDSVLSLKIQEWLSEHKGEINIADFAKVYNVSEARVEQLLNRLVTEGYLESKG